MDLASHWLSGLTREEAGELIQESVVIIPTAATEQHGRHLPIDTDSCIVENVVGRAAARANAPVVSTPVVVFGSSHHHFPFPGVLSLASQTFDRVVRDLLDSLSRSGAQRVYLLNGHGGNDELVKIIAREESRSLGMAVGAASYWSLAWDGFLALQAHQKVGPLPGHAGAFETALMMALRPGSVRTDLLTDTGNAPEGSAWPVGSRGVAFQPEGFLPQGNGTSDDALTATPEWGERLLEAIADSVASTLDQFAEQSRGSGN